jgi:hypothetical protein
VRDKHLSVGVYCWQGPFGSTRKGHVCSPCVVELTAPKELAPVYTRTGRG